MLFDGRTRVHVLGFQALDISRLTSARVVVGKPFMGRMWNAVIIDGLRGRHDQATIYQITDEQTLVKKT